ncbi:MAG: tRNA (guanosine(46)-N7)-methyltransferase TrmB [Porcipelethomonas sp.]
MRIRCKPWAKPELEACEFCINEPENNKGKWNDIFQNKAPVYLELGCGKGGFISQAAPSHPEINYIAVDIKNEMLVLAKRKLEEAYKEKKMNTDNIRIFIKNVEQINDVFGDGDKISRIYINFCNPWPKSKHKKRRLTHFRQLEKYKEFLDGELWFKTDDDDLFSESFEYFEQSGFKIKYKTYDLHASGFEENYETEHEKMFTESGKKIKFLIAEPPLKREDEFK